jgi:hypothetical protein
VVTAPPTVSGAENALLTLDVAASDLDAEAITSLSATGLPAGATFTAGAGNTSGTLSWTPGFNQAGSYTVTFTASNALSDSAITQLTITGTDRAPVVSAPDTVTFFAGQPQSVTVAALDPDGDAITTLTATGLPVGATFTRSHSNTIGTLSWTASSGAGPFTVVFTAKNAMTGTATEFILVTVPTAGVDGDAVQLAPRVLPNPIRNSGQLRFGISREGSVRVDIFDLNGRMIATPMDEARAGAGEFVIPLASPGRGTGPLSPGLYFYRIRTPDGTSRGKFMVLH